MNLTALKFLRQVGLVIILSQLIACDNQQQRHSQPKTEKASTLSPTVTHQQPNFDANLALTDQQILQLAQTPLDDPINHNLPKIIGQHDGVPVAVDIQCSDVCPNHTVRVIHYQLSANQTCQSVSGVEKSLYVPVAIAVIEQKFCFPKIITDNWKTYHHSYNNFAEIQK